MFVSVQPTKAASAIVSGSVALVGNPNAGKTSLFNRLTGAHQKVANYPGVTVERVTGFLNFGSRKVECIDVPGIYSLKALSVDEQVAVEAISTTERPDLVVFVLDSNAMERGLFLLSQVQELGLRCIVAVTMVDELEKSGLHLELGELARLLDLPVFRVEGHTGLGTDKLLGAIDNALDDRSMGIKKPNQSLLDVYVPWLSDRMNRAGLGISRDGVLLALRGGLASLNDRLSLNPDISQSLDEAACHLAGEPLKSNQARYDWSRLVHEAIQKEPEKAKYRVADRIDRVLTHRLWGLLVFVLVMYVVFQSIYTAAAPIMDGISWVFDRFGSWVGSVLSGQELVRSLVVDGLIAGVGGVIVFLPQILLLFFFIATLEGTGYLARAAFLMDKLLGWCGLNGRAFIPLLSSFACAVPGIMAARVMPDQRSRLATILVAPLMSCSARLPVYVLLIGAIIEPRYGPIWAGISLFAMHFVGLVVAIPVVLILNRKSKKAKRLPFYMELPPYRWPRWNDVLLTMLTRAQVFLRTAGTIIVVMSLVIWASLSFPRSPEADAQYQVEYSRLSEQRKTSITEENFVAGRQIEDSFLGRFGRTIEPAFKPAGFDWRISTAILAAFPAREVVVPSLGIIFDLGGDVDEESKDLRKAITSSTWPDGSPLFTTGTTLGLLAFFALCCQCTATLATVKRETNSWKWPTFMFVYMTGLAYLVAVVIHQLEFLISR